MDAPPKVQHVTKASSDELLRKFAGMDDSDSDNEACSASAKRRKPSLKKENKNKKKKSNHNKRGEHEEHDSPSRENGRKSLLPHQRARRTGKSLLINLAISRSHHHRGSRDFKNKSVLGTIEKTWSKAIRGASKVFMEKHYNRHRLLISDMV